MKTFSDDIKMEFGLDKCAKATFTKGKLTKTSDIVLNNDTPIKELDHEETYRIESMKTMEYISRR